MLAEFGSPPPLGILGFPGGPEVLVILLIGLLLFGGRLPEVGRSIGKSLVEFRKGLRGLKDDVGLGREMQDIRRDLEDAARIDDAADWPDTSADPWADIDKQEREAKKRDAFGEVVDTETVEDEAESGETGSEASNEPRGPVARGDLSDS